MNQYNLQFNKLCDQLHLGVPAGEPLELSGGLMHRMFALQTTRGRFAVKALNPAVMARPEAKQNIINSERIARIAAKRMHAVSANTYDGKVVQELDGQYYLVFD